MAVVARNTLTHFYLFCLFRIMVVRDLPKVEVRVRFSQEALRYVAEMTYLDYRLII